MNLHDKAYEPEFTKPGYVWRRGPIEALPCGLPAHLFDCLSGYASKHGDLNNQVVVYKTRDAAINDLEVTRKRAAAASLTPDEITHAAALLDTCRQMLSVQGCNDYLVPNTHENWALVERMGAWNVGGTVEEWRKSSEVRERPGGDTINIPDFALAGYLAAKLRGEC